MSLKNSRDTVITNLTQQSVSIIIFLFLPNLVSVDDYAQITYIAVLLSFMMLSDLGLSFVYNRNMPAVYYSGNLDEMHDWNTTVFWFRFLTSIAFAVIISVIYFIKYQSIINALLLLMLSPLITISSFYISKFNVQSNFSVYRRVNSFQAITKLLVLPLVFLFGLTGWFLSQTASGMLTIVAIKERIFPGKLKINMDLIMAHVGEGLLLVTVTFTWTQLLSSARLFSSFYYPDEIIAQYGLINSGYQIISSLVISAFLPVTVYLLKMIKSDEQHAIDYIFSIISKSIPIVFVLAVFSSEITPLLLNRFFPKYHIDVVIAKTLILSLVTYPILVTIGNLFIGKKKTVHYLVLTFLFLVLNYRLVLYLKEFYGYKSASIAQLISISLYTFTEVLLAFYLFRSQINNKLLKFVQIYGQLSVLCVIYFFFKRLVY